MAKVKYFYKQYHFYHKKLLFLSIKILIHITMKILGLDLGTNSVGWAIVEEEKNNFELVDKGVRIFTEGVKSEKGIESSRAAERTGFRNARKLKYRRKLRKYETLKVLSLNGMCPINIEEIELWKKSGFKNYPLNPLFLDWLKTDDNLHKNPYAYRDKASKQKVTKLELGRALYHIAQRRGFLSNRLDQSAEGILEEHCPIIISNVEDIESFEDFKESIQSYFNNLNIIDNKDLDEGEKKLNSLFKSLLSIIKKNEQDFENAKKEVIEKLNKKENLGKVKGKIKEISQAIHDGNFDTLGQYFHSLYNSGKIRNQYTSREEHYLDEFEIICKVQELKSINETEILPEKRYSGLMKELYRAIFFQRPLKSQKGLIGTCSFEKSKTRCAVSHPDFEEYRMWTYINTIKIKTMDDKALRFLTPEEKQKIIPKFYRAKEHFNFEDLALELTLKNSTFEFYKSSKANSAHYLFNYKKSDTVSGCPISTALKNIFGVDWKTKSFYYKSKNSKGIEVHRNVDYKDLWHLLTVATSNEYLNHYAKEKLQLDDKKAKAFSKIRLKKDFASLSLNAIVKILPYVKEGLLYSHAVFMANINKIVDENIWNDANQRKFIQDKIAEIIENHTFENGLFEVVNSLLKEYKTEDEDGNKTHYSTQAEPIFKNDLTKKLHTFFDKNRIEDTAYKTGIINEIFLFFIEQLKKYEYAKIKRLDEKVLDFLKGKNENGEVFCSDEKRLKKLFHPSDIEVFKKKIIKDTYGNETYILGSPLTQSIKNPMAMRALHQLRKVLNTLIIEGKINEKTIVHIEMARDLNDANKRKGIQNFQNENKENRAKYFEEIKKLYFEETKNEINPTEDDLLRYQLWIEQNRQEIYEATLNNGESKSIKISQIIGSNPDYDIEHTIPRSISQDNSLMNKTLCSKRFNRDVKKQKMPTELNNYDFILPIISHWKEESDNLSREIEMITRAIKGIATKDAKDKKISKRHYLTLKRDYLKGKYERFIWKEPKVGFKNSQIPDTGIITKYAQAYLKSYFKKVESVKGGMVAEFRKIWGIQKSYQENGNKYYEEKDRGKHTHHTIDAITIACMTKPKYDLLASAWQLMDENKLQDARAKLVASKPWATFTQDLVKIEEDILVSHYTPDNVKKQSKKIKRISGKKQYISETTKDTNGKLIIKKDVHGNIIYQLDEKGNKIPRLLQGDTIRGSLHLSTIYGAIEREIENGEKVIKYVVRKPISKVFSDADVKNIVDDGIRERIEKHGLKNVLTKEDTILLPEEKKNENAATADLKPMLIKKIRLYQGSVKNPLSIKKHAPLSKSRQEHKQTIYAQNDENYAMAIYEGKDKKGNIKRSSELINFMDAGKYYKLSNRTNHIFPIAPEKDKDNYPLKYILTKGTMVLLYDKTPEELFEMSSNALLERLFQITQLDVESSGIKLLFHKEAREKKEITEAMGLKIGMKGGKNIGEHKKYPWLKIPPNAFDCLVEGYDFNISPIGKITFK